MITSVSKGEKKQTFSVLLKIFIFKSKKQKRFEIQVFTTVIISFNIENRSL